MAFKPIDIQVNIGKLNEVARIEHLRMNALAAHQKMLDEQAHLRSTLADKRLEELEKQERIKSVQKDKEEKHRSGAHHEDDETEDGGSGLDDEGNSLKDDRAGRIIDVKG